MENHVIFEAKETIINGKRFGGGPQLLLSEEQYHELWNFISNKKFGGTKYFYAYINDSEKGYIQILLVPNNLRQGHLVLHGYVIVKPFKTELKYTITIQENLEGDKLSVSWVEDQSDEDTTIEIEKVVQYEGPPITAHFPLDIPKQIWPSEYILYKNDNIHGESEVNRYKVLRRKMSTSFMRWLDIFYFYDPVTKLWLDIQQIATEEDQREKKFSLENGMQIIIRDNYSHRKYSYVFLMHNGDYYELIPNPWNYTKIMEVEGGIKLE